MIVPYYADDRIALYCGDMRELLPQLGLQADAIVTDPPYGETALKWDQWPHQWPATVSPYAASMWCWGSFRTFTEHWLEFKSGGWAYSHEIVWEKNNGSGFTADRFRRVHEIAVHFYRGPWSDVHHVVPRHPAVYDPRRSRGAIVRSSANSAPHAGAKGAVAAADDHLRLARSVIYAKTMHRRGIHPTEKPVEVLAPLIEYSVPVGGLVLDPFAGSASTLLTARTLGRRAVGIERSEQYCEKAAERLSMPDLFGGAA